MMGEEQFLRNFVLDFMPTHNAIGPILLNRSTQLLTRHHLSRYWKKQSSFINGRWNYAY